MKKEIWKVTFNEYSWISVLQRLFTINNINLRYKLNKRTKAKIGKIFCFKDPIDLYNFVNAYPFMKNDIKPPIVVFKGFAKNITYIKYVYNFSESGKMQIGNTEKDIKESNKKLRIENRKNFEGINNFWKNKKNKKKFKNVLPAPKGICLVSSFIPRERYTWDEFEKILREKL